MRRPGTEGPGLLPAGLGVTAGRGWNVPSITRRWRSRSLWTRGSCACVSSWFGAASVRGANASSRAAVHGPCALLRWSRTPLTRTMSQRIPTTGAFSLDGMHARGRGCSTGLAGRRRRATPARATSERRVRSIGSQKHGTDKRLVITTACYTDDPWTAASIQTLMLLYRVQSTSHLQDHEPFEHTH